MLESNRGKKQGSERSDRLKRENEERGKEVKMKRRLKRRGNEVKEMWSIRAMR